MEQAPQGSGHGSKLQEFKENLDIAFRHRIGILGVPVWHQGLDSMNLESLFQLGIFYDRNVPSKK